MLVDKRIVDRFLPTVSHSEQKDHNVLLHPSWNTVPHKLFLSPSLLQKRHQVRSARVRRHTVFDNLAPLAEHSTDILVPPYIQIPAQCGFLRGHLLMICAAKPRYTAAAAREHRRVLAPRLPTPGASVTSPLHNERCSLRCASAASSCPASKVRRDRCSFANGRPPSKAAWSHFAASRTRSFRHAETHE